MKAYGEYIILKCEAGRTASGIILDASRNIGEVISSNGQLPEGSKVVFVNGTNFTIEGNDYIGVIPRDIIATVE
tara:strand:- start:66 stop:287 length:222 start_codon:yes stop_codon:yes gene_type:complete